MVRELKKLMRTGYCLWMYYRECHKLSRELIMFEKVKVSSLHPQNVFRGVMDWEGVIISKKYNSVDALSEVLVSIVPAEKELDTFSVWAKISEVERVFPLDIWRELKNVDKRFSYHCKAFLAFDVEAEGVFSSISSLKTINKSL